MTSEITTAAEHVRWAAQTLAAAAVDSPQFDAQMLLAWALKARREDLAREPERPLTERERVIFAKAVALRALRRPLPYITGEAWFYGRAFRVNRAVLIPRPETEHLVAVAVNALGGKSGRIADIGTGSGCIAVTIACKVPRARVVATDISRLALLVADKNRRRHRVADRVELREGNLYAPLADEERFDVIVSNPPYVAAGEAPSLQPEVRDYEPPLALFGAESASSAVDDWPSLLRQRLFAGAARRLAPGGIIAVEIGAGQGAEAEEQARSAGYGAVKTIVDLAGIARVIVAGSWAVPTTRGA